MKMSIESRLIIVITFLSILAASIGMLGTFAAALFGDFLIHHIYRDLRGEPDETTGESGRRQSDRGRRPRGLFPDVPSSTCPTRRLNVRLLGSI